MKKLLILLSIFIFQNSSVLACTCAGKTSFCDLNFQYQTDHVFIGKILRDDSLYSEFEIIENLRGVELRDTVLIWDNPAPMNSCVGYFEKDSKYLGNVGDSILIILSRIDSIDTWGVLGDYYRPLGVCSSPYLPITNGLIIGNLTKQTITRPSHLKLFEQTLLQFNLLVNCTMRMVGHWIVICLLDYPRIVKLNLTYAYSPTPLIRPLA